MLSTSLIRRRPSEKHIRMEKDGDFQCVECCFPIKRLYIQYSPGNIRLKRCGNCKNVADEYIECEHMITVIDLILHKPKAYRHLFYNKFTKGTLDFEGLLWGSTLGYLILDAYTMSILSLNEKDWTSAMSFASLWHYYGEFLIGIIVGNVVFMLILLIGFEKFINASAAGLGCLYCRSQRVEVINTLGDVIRCCRFWTFYIYLTKASFILAFAVAKLHCEVNSFQATSC